MMKQSRTRTNKKRKDEIELRNKADQAVYNERLVEGLQASKLSSSDKSAIKARWTMSKKASRRGPTARRDSKALDTLTSAFHKARKPVYGNRRPVAARKAADRRAVPRRMPDQPASGRRGDVIDAEVVDEESSELEI